MVKRLEKNRVVVIAGGDFSRFEAELIRPETDLIITADAGAVSLEAHGLVPDIAVGDFDTTGIDYIETLKQKGVRVIPLPAEKEVTDLHFALLCATRQKPDEILILGALGGDRADHMLANIGLLEWLKEEGKNATMLHPANRLRLLSGPGKMRFDTKDFQYVSLLPVSRKVTGIETDGLKYPLKKETLYRGRTRGISNELVKVPAFVSVEEGICLVVESRE
jgi:thiamine pyrophosphokinase